MREDVAMQESCDEKIRIVSKQAAEWFIRLKDKQMGRLDQQLYVAWLKRSPENVSEQLRMLTLYRLLRQTRVRNTWSASRKHTNVVELKHRPSEDIPENVQAADNKSSRRRVAGTVFLMAFFRRRR